MPDKKLVPDVLLPVSPEKMQQLQKTAKDEFIVITKRIKNSDGTLNAMFMELIIVEMWLKLVKMCHNAAQVSESQKPMLAQMIDRMHVLTNQMEELLIHGRDIQIPEEESGRSEVVHFDPDNTPDTVKQAYEDAGVNLESQ